MWDLGRTAFKVSRVSDFWVLVRAVGFGVSGSSALRFRVDALNVGFRNLDSGDLVEGIRA